MARLVKMWKTKEPDAKTTEPLMPKQMPLVVDEKLAMVMDISGLKALRESSSVKGKQLDEFKKKLNLLTLAEQRASFVVACKDMLNVLDQAVPCIGCRRSVERLFYDLSNLNCHPALDPIIITPDGILTIRQEIIENPLRLCTLLQGHSTRLNDLVEQQPRNKKSRRCALHSLEVQRMRPPPNAWREVWDCMEHQCLKEITFIESETLTVTLETYLRKHKFCSECRTKVLLASSLLTTECDPTQEKGYVSSLYADIKRCTNGHVQLPVNIDYISSIIGRAQPELMGRERHAKTLEIAQEEVLTCLGICVAERLNRVYRRLKEEEIIVKVLAAVAVDTLSRNFQVAVEIKQGITQLEVLYKEFKRKEMAEQQRREKLRLKRKKKKERRDVDGKENENEDKENEEQDIEDECECFQEELDEAEEDQKIKRRNIKRIDEIQSTTQTIETISSQEKLNTSLYHIDRHKLQVLDPKNKGPPNCNCPDCAKKMEDSNQTASALQSNSMQSTKKEKKNKKKNETKSTNKNSKKPSKNEKVKNSVQLVSDQLPKSDFCKNDVSETSDEWHDGAESKEPPSSEHLMNELMDTNKRYTMWIEVKRLNSKANNRNCRSSSEHSSQDYGYSSEHIVSSPSLPSTPEGSEVACSDGCCNHEGDCPDTRPTEKLVHSDSTLCILREHGGGLTLSQMLEDSYFCEDKDNCSYIPVEEVLEFKSRMCQVAQKREELRRTLKKRFAMLCSHHKPLTISR